MSRKDDPRMGDLFVSKESASTSKKTVIALIGYPWDEGVRRNGGRVGAKEGPAAFRKRLVLSGALENREVGINLCAHVELVDFGDIAADDLESAHKTLQSTVLKALDSNFIPFIIGGGNDQSYSNAKALMGKYGGKIKVINIDAHLDVRPVQGGVVHSGTPFRQLIDDVQFQGDFVEFAVQGSQCSGEHALFILGKGGQIRWLKDLRSTSTVEDHFNNEIQHTPTFLSFDVDSIRGSDCPGVSCPAVIGLKAQEAVNIMELAGRNGQVKMVDFSEYNPGIENDRTGRLLSLMFYHFLLGVAQRKQP